MGRQVKTMNDRDEKLLMWESATLYYEKKHTQQEIAELMGLSRQTVSKLLNDAIKENIVEIKIHDPQKNCRELERLLCARFGLSSAVVCTVSGKQDTLRQIMTVKAAAEYISPIIQRGNLKIAVSWGRTIHALISQMDEIHTSDNLVFPLFGATDVEDPCFSSNEIARALADKTHANVQYAWFPYLTDSAEDHLLLKKTGYYKKIEALWNKIDLALVGIGNADIVSMFGRTVGCTADAGGIAGDIATHFFDENGKLSERHQHTLCASASNIAQAGQTIAIACGSDKADAIHGALKTGLLDVLVTDEHTAREVLGI